MCVRPRYRGFLFPVILAVLGALAAAETSAQEEVLRLYGSVGPSPAMEEAAMIFATRKDVKIQVISGPRNIWRDKAALNADLMFSSADFMMSDYAHSMNLQIDDDTITPLFLRPSAILVRPGNPKQINDFPDLVRPGVNVMVVNSAGHTGLWEDMAGKLEDIRTVRALRKNIVIFAANPDEAMTAWKTKDDVDAWITWNTWHVPLRGRAELVPVSKPYRVLRTCSIALTERGKGKPAAAEFIKFLTSPEAAATFDTWGWLSPKTDASPVTVSTDIAFVCRVGKDEWNKEAGMGQGLATLKRVMGEYRAIGIAFEELHVSAIFHDDAARWLLSDEAYRGPAGGREGENPNKSVIQELIKSGVSIEMCAQTMKEHGWTKKDLLPDIKIVPAAYPRLIDLESRGYSHVSF